jgi:hypothetical protein
MPAAAAIAERQFISQQAAFHGNAALRDQRGIG